MEITIIKKLYLENVEVPDGLTEEELKAEVNRIIDGTYIDGYDETDWRGMEVYDVYDDYSGEDLFTIER